MSCAVAIMALEYQPFRFPYDPAPVTFVRTRSQIGHGSSVQKSLSMWAIAPASTALEGLNYSAGQNEVEYVALLYTTNDHFALKDFLDKYPWLVALLVEAYPRLRAAFGARAELSLELQEDTESVGQFELFGVARVAMPVEQGIAALDSFDSGWWFDASRKGQGKLNFTVEYL